MSRVPETGYYFEPITERLVVLVEASPFPSDDDWAFVGDTIGMSPDEARLQIAERWPGVDPADLEVEFDLDFDRAIEDADRRRLEEEAGALAREPSEVNLDLKALLEQAEALRSAAAQVTLSQTTAQSLEAAAEQAALAQLERELQDRADPAVAVAHSTPGERTQTVTVSPGTRVVRVPKRRPRVRK
jgi:hypothetical protein